MEVDSHRSSPSYYTILGVDQNSSASEIRNAYRKLAMQWHPDKWTKTPSLLEKAKSKFQQIQEAYSVLSDQGKRTLYDVGLYDPDDETNDEGFADFMQEMISLMNDVKKQILDLWVLQFLEPTRAPKIFSLWRIRIQMAIRMRVYSLSLSL
ncbi:PREDICTED: dnaJ homolog subfamily B member 6-A-like isoform X2 [Nelumbo nucifera]|uniref:DnaJ homolog subfamily B member 6-A-like isoform X2 n=1 Tax=Nelumbo nucifera TaxID=4432 RepID=A0A1U7ZJ39_NELNU|nr:PREDICTED: dnaJ homolog subfamily B member 6-A-like isoform X2 [Nelumbo nucifera]XP_019053159.1 PREDICTED: dnaJ homolog subfamily B member 6-A-like isoform X2 [Nelumbo nucifera]